MFVVRDFRGKAGALCSIWNDKQFRCPTALCSACLGRWREAAGRSRPVVPDCSSPSSSLPGDTFPVRRAILPSWGHAGKVPGALPSPLPLPVNHRAMGRAVRWRGIHPEQKVSFKRSGRGEPLEFGASSAGWGPSPGCSPGALTSPPPCSRDPAPLVQGRQCQP